MTCTLVKPKENVENGSVKNLETWKSEKKIGFRKKVEMYENKKHTSDYYKNIGKGIKHNFSVYK